MLGHIFPTSGAVCLAIAPLPRWSGDYVIVARHQSATTDQYVVATVTGRDIVESTLAGKTGPDGWNSGTYIAAAHGGRLGAVNRFLDEIGLDVTPVDREQIKDQIDRAMDSSVPDIIA